MLLAFIYREIIANSAVYFIIHTLVSEYHFIGTIGN